MDWPGGAFFEDDDGVAEKFLAGDGCGALLLVRGKLSRPYMEDIFSLYYMHYLKCAYILSGNEGGHLPATCM